jgi:hypothetical protein
MSEICRPKFIVRHNTTTSVYIKFSNKRQIFKCNDKLIKQITSDRRGIWREHSSKKWFRPRFSVDLIKGLQMSREKPKLTQIFHLSSGVPLTFFLGTICRNCSIQLKKYKDNSPTGSRVKNQIPVK